MRQSGRIAVATAMFGIAATLIKLGTMFHRRFGVPIPTHSDSSSKIKLDSQQANLLRDAIVLIIDESSMMNHKLLDLLDRFLRILMVVYEYMGGKWVILMHDFRQILPVIPQGRQADIVAAAIINSEAWEHFTLLRLRQNMRVQRILNQDPSPENAVQLQQYSDLLLHLGEGKLPSCVPGIPGIIEIPDEMVCTTRHKKTCLTISF